MAVISFDECLKKRMLVRIAPDRRLAEKEMSVAKEDLCKARHTFEADMDYKWSIVKAYYAMFHAARALLYAIGLREKPRLHSRGVENAVQRGKDTIVLRG